MGTRVNLVMFKVLKQTQINQLNPKAVIHVDEVAADC